MIDDGLQVTQEPRVDTRRGLDLFQRRAGLEGVAHFEQPTRGRALDALKQIGLLRRVAVVVVLARAVAVGADLHAAHRFLQRLTERPADGHDLADRLHLVAKGVVCFDELLEGETRDFGHHVVDGWFETRRGFPRDIIAQLVERVADGQLGRNLGNREAGGLRGQRG